MSIDRDTRAKLIASIEQRIGAMEDSLLTVTTSSTFRREGEETAANKAGWSGPTLTQDGMKAKFREWGQFLREYRRTNVTIVVTLGHQGPMIWTRHPTDGTFIECSFSDARVIHRQQPLRLVKVIDRDTAHFEVWSPLHGPLLPLLAPPYAPPPD